MTNRWLKGVAVAALTAVGAVAAQAADLPTRKEAPAPVFVPPPFTWTGFYIGVNAGGIWPSGGRNASILDPNAAIDGGFISAGFPGGLGSQSAGFIGGGQAGYNWQTGAFVLGVETDFDGSTLSKSFNNIGAPFAAAAPLGGDFLTVNGKTSLTWLGTTRARVGFVATPDNRLMIYATGGVAYGGGNSQFSVFDTYDWRFLERQPQLNARRLDDRRRCRIRGHQQHHDQGRISVRRSRQQQLQQLRKRASAMLLPGRLCGRKGRLQRLDLPRGRELQVLSLQSFELRTSWPEEGQPSSGFFCACVAVALRSELQRPNTGCRRCQRRFGVAINPG